MLDSAFKFEVLTINSNLQRSSSISDQAFLKFLELTNLDNNVKMSVARNFATVSDLFRYFVYYLFKLRFMKHEIFHLKLNENDSIPAENDSIPAENDSISAENDLILAENDNYFYNGCRTYCPACPIKLNKKHVVYPDEKKYGVIFINFRICGITFE